jgi:synaptobrevin family protein YKT6
MLGITYFIKSSNKFEKKSESYDLNDFSYWQSGTIKKSCSELCMDLLLGTPINTFRTVNVTDIDIIKDYVIYIRSASDHGVTCISKISYPKRLIYELMNEIEAYLVNSDSLIVPSSELDKIVLLSKDRLKDDKITKIQGQLDSTKDIMVDNIDKILQRGEKLDVLVLKSEELELLSRKFVNDTKKLNSCCTIL